MTRESDEALQARWAERQERLQGLVADLGGVGLQFRADLAKGRFWWQREDGRPVVVASTRFLLSYANSNHSILCGWENGGMPPSATVPEVPGIAARVSDCTEADAWLHAMRVAEAVGAHYLYRAPSAQSSAFLGLWDVRAAREGDEPFAAAAPWPYVRRVLASIASELDEGRDVSALVRGYGRTFADDYIRRGTSLEAPLRSLGDRLAALEKAPRDAQRDTLAALLGEAERHDAQ